MIFFFFLINMFFTRKNVRKHKKKWVVIGGHVPKHHQTSRSAPPPTASPRNGVRGGVHPLLFLCFFDTLGVVTDFFLWVLEIFAQIFSENLVSR